MALKTGVPISKVIVPAMVEDQAARSRLILTKLPALYFEDRVSKKRKIRCRIPERPLL